MMNLSCTDVATVANLGSPKKIGQELAVICPRHDDQHPSLKINPTKNNWMCGPCGESGTAAFHLLKNNAVKLVRKSGEMLIEGISETLIKGGPAPKLPKPQPEDPFYPEALRISKVAGQTSNLFLQRRLGLGPVHAGRLIDRMEKKGYCGPTNNRSPREWLGKEIKQASDQDSPLNNQRAASPERLQQEDE